MVEPTVFVTGGAGFIGSAVTQHLARHSSYYSVVIDWLTCVANLERLAILLPDAWTLERVEISDTEAIAPC